MSDERPPLLRSLRLALVLGGMVGAVVGGVVAFQFTGWRALPIGLLAGAVFGAIASLDAVIPGPPRSIRTPARRGDRIGPFRGGTTFAVATVLALLATAYATNNRIELNCSRPEPIQLECRRTVYVWLGQVQAAETVYRDIAEVSEGRPNQIVVLTSTDTHEFIDGFGPDDLATLQRFLDSTDQTLHLTSYDLWFFAPIFFFATLLCGWLAVIQYRRGLALLRQTTIRL